MPKHVKGNEMMSRNTILAAVLLFAPTLGCDSAPEKRSPSKVTKADKKPDAKADKKKGDEKKADAKVDAKADDNKADPDPNDTGKPDDPAGDAPDEPVTDLNGIEADAEFDGFDPLVAKAATLAKSIEAKPDDTDVLLAAVSLDREGLDALMYQIATDPDLTAQYRIARGI